MVGSLNGGAIACIFCNPLNLIDSSACLLAIMALHRFMTAAARQPTNAAIR